MKDIHANPQFRREHTLCLNGEWDFEILSSPFGDGLSERELKGKIIVPYCPESELSGIGYTDFIYYCAYAKRFSLSKSDLSGRVLLRFGACDYEAFVYVNGERVGSHRGGYSSFCFDVTRFVSEGENTYLCSFMTMLRTIVRRENRRSKNILTVVFIPASREYGSRYGWNLFRITILKTYDLLRMQNAEHCLCAQIVRARKIFPSRSLMRGAGWEARPRELSNTGI